MSWHGPSAPRVEGIATKSRVVASCASKPASTASRIFCCVSVVMRRLQSRIQRGRERAPYPDLSRRRNAQNAHPAMHLRAGGLPNSRAATPDARHHREAADTVRARPARCAPECARHRSAMRSPPRRRQRPWREFWRKPASISIAMTDVALISCAVLCRRLGGAIGEEAVDHGDQRALLLGGIVDEMGSTECHHGAVIGRVIEAAPCKHQAVEMRDGETCALAVRLVA